MTIAIVNCAAKIFEATRVDPAEYCEELAEEGSDYCEGHDPENEPEYEPEDSYDDQDYWIERDAENDAYEDWI